MVSLGIKNLKGLLNDASRQRCHSADPSSDLNYHLVIHRLSKLKIMLVLNPHSLTLFLDNYDMEKSRCLDSIENQ